LSSGKKVSSHDLVVGGTYSVTFSKGKVRVQFQALLLSLDENGKDIKLKFDGGHQIEGPIDEVDSMLSFNRVLWSHR